MADPFRKFFLDTVERVTAQEPNEESFLELLQIVSSGLTLDQMISSKSDERRKIFKALILRIHPDKHPNDSRATTLFQNVQNFYKDCSDLLQSSSSLTRLPSPSSTSKSKSKGTNSKRSSMGSTSEASTFSGSRSPSSPLSPSGGARGKTAKRRRRMVHNFPHHFSVYTKWPHMNIFEKHDETVNADTISSMGQNSNGDSGMKANVSPSTTSYPYPPNKEVSKDTLPLFQAYKCIHTRGAIAHGKRITKIFTWNNVMDDHWEGNQIEHTVKNVFDAKFGGAKILETVEEIKEELMTNGPVISVSFKLMDAYLDQLRDGGSDAFVKDLLKGGEHINSNDKSSSIGDSGDGSSSHKHELLIVGWSLTPFGEAWKVQSLFDRNTSDSTTLGVSPPLQSSLIEPPIIHIGIGQFHINDICLAPKSNLENISWQPGPYFNVDFLDAPQWREWKQMDLPLTQSELVLLGKCFRKGIFSGEKFVICDRDKLAHSSSYIVKNLRLDDNTKEWIVTVSLVS